MKQSCIILYSFELLFLIVKYQSRQADCSTMRFHSYCSSKKVHFSALTARETIRRDHFRYFYFVIFKSIKRAHF